MQFNKSFCTTCSAWSSASEKIRCNKVSNKVLKKDRYDNTSNHIHFSPIFWVLFSKQQSCNNIKDCVIYFSPSSALIALAVGKKSSMNLSNNVHVSPDDTPQFGINSYKISYLKMWFKTYQMFCVFASMKHSFNGTFHHGYFLHHHHCWRPPCLTVLLKNHFLVKYLLTRFIPNVFKWLRSSNSGNESSYILWNYQ